MPAGVILKIPPFTFVSVPPQIGSIKIAVVAERDGLRIADVAVEREQDFIDSRGRHLIYGAGDCAPVSGGAVEVAVFTLDRWSIGRCSFGVAVEVVHHGDGPGGGDLEEGSVSDCAAGGVVPYRLPSVARVRPLFGRPPMTDRSKLRNTCMAPEV